jgi:hypothetical protein
MGRGGLTAAFTEDEIRILHEKYLFIAPKNSCIIILIKYNSKFVLYGNFLLVNQ